MNILEAINTQNVNLIKEVLAHDPMCIDDIDNDGTPMSFVAARTGHLESVKYIVEYSRASMNIVDENNRNILHYAAMSGNVPLAEYLIEKVGMSATSPDVNLVTPIDIADFMGHDHLKQSAIPR